MLNHLFSEEIPPDAQPEPPLAHLEAISSVVGCLGEESNIHLITSSFQPVLEGDKVPPTSPFLQATHPQISQPPLTGLTH